MVFPAALRETLDTMSGGLNELPGRRADEVREVAYEDAAILKDVDTPEDYEHLGQ